jgi:hypothetical protein
MDFLLRKSGGPFALFAKDYELLHNGAACCVLRFDDWKHVAFSIAGNRFDIRSNGRARWVLEQSGIKVGCCKRHASGPQLAFSIEFDDRVWCFKPNRRKLVLTHDIWEGNLEIGRITPHIRYWSSEVGATLTQVPRLEVIGFAVWLIGIHWTGVAGTLTAGSAELGI